MFRMPPTATSVPASSRSPGVYFTSKNSGTVINRRSRNRLMMNPLRPTRIMTTPEMMAAENAAMP